MWLYFVFELSVILESNYLEKYIFVTLKLKTIAGS